MPTLCLNQGALLGVFELGARLQSFLRSPWQNQLAVDQLELRNGNGDIVFRQAKKANRIDDGVGNRLIGRDDDVIMHVRLVT